MTAKVLATLGALGLILTIWTADFRYLWTGLILLLIAIGIAAHKDGQAKKTSPQVKTDATPRSRSPLAPTSFTPGDTTLPPGMKMDIWYTTEKRDDGKQDVWQHDRLENGIANTHLGAYTEEQMRQGEHRKGQK